MLIWHVLLYGLEFTLKNILFTLQSILLHWGKKQAWRGSDILSLVPLTELLLFWHSTLLHPRFLAKTRYKKLKQFIQSTL